MLEFTGERVVPGLVEPALLDEHLARYRFAARLVNDGAVLDAGCGSGYGCAELSGDNARVFGIDISAEAIDHAAKTFGGPFIHFLQASCESLPFAEGTFDLVVAFEVIEHLRGWRLLLEEACRVLGPGGIFVVSTPNKAYYTETRAAAGPNPFHVHEFEFDEFRTAMKAVFPYVHLLTQNRSEAIVFLPPDPSLGVLDTTGDADPETAHFFLAICSRSPVTETRAFAWLPKAGNLLRERERHIALLEDELRLKAVWLREAQESHATLQQAHEILLAELDRQNAWADRLNAELKRSGDAIGGLQTELDKTHAGYRKSIAGYEEQIARNAQEAGDRLAWIHDLEAQIAHGIQEIARQKAEHQSDQASILDLHQKAQGLEVELRRESSERQRIEAENTRLKEERRLIGDSRWIRLGNKLNLGPVLKSE